MAEFTLPKNSKIQKGKLIDAAGDAKKPRKFNIYRYDPDNGEIHAGIHIKSIYPKLALWCLMRLFTLRIMWIRH